MTDLTKPVRRLSIAEKYSRGRSRRIVVELLPTCIGFRLHGERRKFFLSYIDGLALAIRADAAATKARKAAERQARKKTWSRSSN